MRVSIHFVLSCCPPVLTVSLVGVLFGLEIAEQAEQPRRAHEF